MIGVPNIRFSHGMSLGRFVTMWSIYPAICSWIDPDTIQAKLRTNSYVSQHPFELVFSDEFNEDGRTFRDGEDPRWTAIDKDDYTNSALQYYNEELASTKEGKLSLKTVLLDKSFLCTKSEGRISKCTKNYQSSMIQGWNKFCFTGGIVEVRARLPGKYDIGGLWPAIWLLGNLARATYVGSSDNMWPWSFDICQKRMQRGQAISACNSVNHYGMKSFQGRGAPEIDILEAMPGSEKLTKQVNGNKINKPYFSSSLQVSPGIGPYRPDVGNVPDFSQWYQNGLSYGPHLTYNSSLNIFFYGTRLEHTEDGRSYQADALSANSQLEKSHFSYFHTYRLEWKSGPQGYLRWYLDGTFIYSVESDFALNKTDAKLPDEPMYIIFNTALSSTWGFPQPCPVGCKCDCYDCRKVECRCALPIKMCDNFPASFDIDWVRVYQNME